jgi:hypothetical protein
MTSRQTRNECCVLLVPASRWNFPIGVPHRLLKPPLAQKLQTFPGYQYHSQFRGGDSSHFALFVRSHLFDSFAGIEVSEKIALVRSWMLGIGGDKVAAEEKEAAVLGGSGEIQAGLLHVDPGMMAALASQV